MSGIIGNINAVDDLKRIPGETRLAWVREAALSVVPSERRAAVLDLEKVDKTAGNDLLMKLVGDPEEDVQMLALHVVNERKGRQ